ncbi:MAG TPA: hypothetical protein VE820_04410 [Sphingomicrobium sp.]|nr:hypothetical protein [Sphingomicrobium sp.]
MHVVMIFIAALASSAQPSSAETLGEARGAALQADARHALELLRGVDATSLSVKDRNFVTCMRTRFGSAVPATTSRPASFADRVLAIYYSYWYAALTRPDVRNQEERRLDASLRKLLKARTGADLDVLLKKRLGAAGLHSLEGRTGLLRELMVWRKQEEVDTPVALPEAQFRVKVYYLDGFKSFGWSYYATCGRSSTGGWTTDGGLYVVVPRYDSLRDEQFRVSFLAHEAQHFADKARFKDLKPWELEFRAKLVEVALAEKTRTDVLDSFVDDQGDDPADAHSYADRKLLADLTKRLRLGDVRELYAVEPKALQSAAREALLDDSRRRSGAVDTAAKK